MAESSNTFNHGDDAFWDHVDDVLAENEEVMKRIRRPGSVGAVICRPSFLIEQPPQADNVVDLNANVVDISPPDIVA